MSCLSDNDYGSPSPYPPSSCSDSDTDPSPSHITSTLRTSITSVSEAHLLAIMIKLADDDPHFKHAIMNELSYLATPPDTPTTPTPRGKPHRKVHRHRKPSTRNVKPVDYKFSSQEDKTVMRKMIYHPGHLEDELFEIFTVSPQGQTFKAIRKITMWSCCDEDEWCLGCTSLSVPKPWAL